MLFKTKLVSNLLILVIILFSQNSQAVEIRCSKSNFKKGLNIMKKVDSASKRYKTQISDVYMEIINEKKQIRKRYFTSSKKRYDNLVKNLIKFYKPSNIKNTSLLTHSYENKQDDLQWFYLPALRSIKQLNSSDKYKSFMGSDFTNSDVAGRNVNKDYHCYVKEDEKYYIVNSFPKDKNDKYSRLELIINKQIDIPVRVTFYTKNNSGKEQLLKILNNKKIDKFENDLFLVTYSEMKNKIRNSSTMIKVLNVKLNKKIADTKLGIKGLKND